MAFESQEQMQEFAAERGLGALADKMGITLTEVSVERLCGSMPVAGNTQPLGLLHGGANVVLAESLGSIAANLYAAPAGFAVGLEINATHLKSATEGSVHGVATPVKLGGTVAVYEIEIRDDAGELTCVSRLTCVIRQRRQA